MPLYLARMEHPDGDRWGQYVVEHVLYLKELIAQGRLLASGPLRHCTACGLPDPEGRQLARGPGLDRG